jgi:hypothetical protein
MVAATTARAVPQPDSDFDEGFDEQLEGEGAFEDSLSTEGDFDEMTADEFAEFDE